MRGCELCLWLQDKLMTVVAEEGTSGGDNVHWIFKNKDHGKAAATASLGLVTLWDVEGGLPQLDKYLYSKDPHVVAGALLGVGIVNSNIRVSRSCHRSLTSAGGSSLKEGLAYRKPWNPASLAADARMIPGCWDAPALHSLTATPTGARPRQCTNSPDSHPQRKQGACGAG